MSTAGQKGHSGTGRSLGSVSLTDDGGQIQVSGISEQLPAEKIADQDSQPQSGNVVSTPVIVAGVVALVVGLMGFVGAGVAAGQGPQIDPGHEQRISQLRSGIETAEAQRESLPRVDEVERMLVNALQAGVDVAQLQNDYRSLTPAVAANRGRLEADRSEGIRRQLSPHFDDSVDPELLNPWYLLSSDSTAGAGIGIPQSFHSGFAWYAQVPTTIELDSNIAVTWVARATSGDTTTVLAWARANYDPTRQVFTDLTTVTTTAGALRGMEVQPA